MIIIKNSHRAFEEAPIAFEAVSNPSSDFLSDFSTMVSWCAANGNVQNYHRKNFGMNPEPYGIDVSSIPDVTSSTAALVHHALSVVEPHKGQWQWLYENLADLDSKMLLLNVLAYRALGWKYVPMPLDSQSFWSCMRTLGQLESTGQDISELGLAPAGKLKKINLNSFGVNVELFSDAFGVFNEFIYSQYVYRGRNTMLLLQEGDHVLDCGACFGGTSLYFADRVGPTGKVISYEFFPENIAIFNENMRLNPQLKERVTLVPMPVWIKPGVQMWIEGSGPATQVHTDGARVGQGSPKFRSTTIDETVKSHALQRVDLIKMDIENAEMLALRGAMETIQKFRPNLAICVYHKLIDFFEIPQEIAQLNLGYKFYLQHSTVHGDETVIFASARGGAPGLQTNATTIYPIQPRKLSNRIKSRLKTIIKKIRGQ